MSCGTVTSRQNIALADKKTVYGVIVGMFLSETPFSFTDVDTAKLEASWDTEINKAAFERVFVLNHVDLTEPDNQDDVLFVLPNSNTNIKISDGARNVKFTWHALPSCLMNKLRTFNEIIAYACFIHEKNYISGDLDSSLQFIPIEVRLRAENPKLTGGRDAPDTISVNLEIVDPDRLLREVIEPSFDAKSKDGIIDVTLTEVSSSSTEIVVSVKTECDCSEVIGLVTGDFDVSSTSTVVDNEDGTYTLSGTYTGTVTVTLANQPTMTTKGYETGDTLSTTIA